MSSNNLSNLQDFFSFISSDEDFIANADELNPSIRDLEVNLDFDEILKDLVNSTLIFEQTDSTNKITNKQTKRQRTTFTSKQIIKMESYYRHQNYLERTQRIKIAEELDLPEETVKFWFQNRRTKDKRLSKEEVLNEIPLAQFQNCNRVPHLNINYTTSCKNQQEVPNTLHPTFQNWNGVQQQYHGSNPSLVATRANFSNKNYHHGNQQFNNSNYNYHNNY